MQNAFFSACSKLNISLMFSDHFQFLTSELNKKQHTVWSPCRAAGITIQVMCHCLSQATVPQGPTTCSEQ